VSIRSGHGVGTTTFESWLILWFLLTRTNCKIPVAANSQDQLRDTIWPEIAKWHRQLPEPLKAMIDVQAERTVVAQDPGGAVSQGETGGIPTSSSTVASAFVFVAGTDGLIYQTGGGAETRSDPTRLPSWSASLWPPLP